MSDVGGMGRPPRTQTLHVILGLHVLMRKTPTHLVRGTLASLLAFAAAIAGADYVPSVGIPDPAQYWQGGVDPVDAKRPNDPASWPTAATEGFYYIDNTHSLATDTGNPNGYPARPRLTMPTSLPAGAVVVVRGGPYTPANFTNLQWLGTPTAPIWISGDPATRTNFRNTWRLRQASYVLIENIAWSHQLEANLDLRPGSDSEKISHVAVRNCTITGLGTPNTGQSFSQSSGYANPVTHVVYVDCEASYGGQWDLGSQNDHHGFGVGTNHQYTWWIRCYAHHMGGDAYGNGHDANHSTHHLFYDRCRSDDTNGEDAVDLKEVHAVVFSGCDFRGSFVIHYGPTTGEGPYDFWLINSTLGNPGADAFVSTALNSAPGSSAWIIGNVIQNAGRGLYPDRGGGTFFLLNNTLVDCASGILATGAVDSITAQNNLVYGGTTQIRVDSSAVRAASTFTNSLVFRPSGSVSIAWGSTFSSVSGWISGTTAGDDSLGADPEFTNSASGDFSLRSSSPAREAGRDWRSTANVAFNKAFGFTPAWADRNGVPFDSAPDIGALQFGVSSSLPAAPSGASLGP